MGAQDVSILVLRASASFGHVLGESRQRCFKIDSSEDEIVLSDDRERDAALV